MKNELGIGISLLTEKIYVGRKNKAKNMWVGEKKDVTEDFIDCMFSYLELQQVRSIKTVNHTTNEEKTHLFMHITTDKESLENTINYLNKQLEKAKSLTIDNK